jgi:hypothetical protein
MYYTLFIPQRGQFLWYKIWCYAIFFGGFYIALTLVTMMECLPREKIWDTSISGDCKVNKSKLLLVSGIANVLTDLQVVVIPIETVWKLQMSLAQRIRVILVFTIGLM